MQQGYNDIDAASLEPGRVTVAADAANDLGKDLPEEGEEGVELAQSSINKSADKATLREVARSFSTGGFYGVDILHGSQPKNVIL